MPKILDLNKKKTKPRDFYEIKATADSADVYIYDYIGETWDGESTTAKKFVKDLAALKTGIINLHINSPGGSVFDGTAIYNALRQHKAHVNTYIDGLAASIASVVALAGDHVYMASNALFMIHNPWSITIGDANTMRKTADWLDKVRDTIVAAYDERSFLERDDIAKAMDDETWYTADEAMAAGFVDDTTGAVDLAACAGFDLSDYRNAGKASALLESGFTAPEPGRLDIGGQLNLTTAIRAGKEEDEKMDIETLKAQHPDVFNSVLELGRTAGLEAGMKDVEAKVQAARAEGATAERERVQAVFERGTKAPGQDKLVAEMMFDGKTTGPEAGDRLFAAEASKRAGVLDSMRAGDTKVSTTDGDAAHVDEPAAGASIEDKAKAEWEKDPKLRAEFSGNFKAYLAYAQAESEGRVKVKGY